jgi:hypothetical protein
MLESNRGLSTVLAVGVVVVAVLGYVLGAHSKSTPAHDRSSSHGELRPTFAASVLVESPSGWKPALPVPAVPGLTIIHPVAFAPLGNPAHAGLVTGQLQGGEPTPLPAAFVAQLAVLPETQVVSLSQTEAFRYSGVSLPGFLRSLTIFAIPNPGSNPTVLVCYADAAAAADMHTCEQIVASLRPVGQTGANDLTPDPAYASSVSSAIMTLDGLRLTLRQQMRLGATLPSVQRLATRLKDGFVAAVASLARLEAPVAAGQAHAALSRAVLGARDAYAALAAAAAARSLARYEAARARVYEAEAQVDSSLQSFALLGYHSL